MIQNSTLPTISRENGIILSFLFYFYANFKFTCLYYKKSCEYCRYSFIATNVLTVIGVLVKRRDIFWTLIVYYIVLDALNKNFESATDKEVHILPASISNKTDWIDNTYAVILGRPYIPI